MVECQENPRRGRGRPKNSKKVSLIGVPVKEKKVTYEKKNYRIKQKTLLVFLVNQETVKSTLQKEYVLRIDDLRHINGDNLRDTFVDDKVNTDISKYSMKEDAMKSQIYHHKKKEKNDFTCYLCSKSVEGSSVQCDSCLVWIHIQCTGISKKELQKLVYYCPQCEQIFLT